MTLENKKNTVTVTALLFFLFLVLIFSALNFSPVNDEIAHLPAGYSYLKTGEIKLNPQHPPLVKLLSALPLLFLKPNFSYEDLKLGEWRFGSKFLSENGIDQLLFWGRLAPILISILLGLFIFKWAKELFGAGPGLLALILYILTPEILAHSQIVTTDLAVAAFSFITIYWLWRFMKSSFKKHLLYLGLFYGLALGSKFSALILAPVIVFFLIWRVFREKDKLSPKFWRLTKILLAIFVVAYAVVFIFYLFPRDPLFYFKGYQTIYTDHNPNFNFYLNGKFSSNGWWYYFFEAFLIKTPLPFLMILTAAIILWRKLPIKSQDRFLLLLPALLWFLVISWKASNIGLRYILTVYPFLIVFSAGLTQLIFARRRLPMILILFFLFVWQGYTVLRISPDFLAYFNELVGGPVNGYKYLDDSNINWGQDLKRVAGYQKNHPDAKVVIPWQFADPTHYGIKNFTSNAKIKDWLNPEGEWVVDVNYLIRTKLASQKIGESGADWLKLYKPVDRIGYSFFVFRFDKN